MVMITKTSIGQELYVIAEIGVNHGGDIKLAKELIDLAKKGGAHAAKFQSYKAHKIAAKDSPAYWDTSKEPTQSQFELFKKFDSFGPKDYEELAAYCKEVGIDFLSTPFDLEAVDFLNPLQRLIKVASADITNFPLLRKVAASKKPIILSTGCSTIQEITSAVSELTNYGATEIVLLHCILNYPTSDENANLGMITSLQQEFPGCHIGYSDHTIPSDEMTVLCASYVLGARVIEKHFTHDKTLQGNDHYHSMDWKDLQNFINRVFTLNSIIGLNRKEPLSSEMNSIKYARRSLYYTRDLLAGHEVSESDLAALRPGTGTSPVLIDNYIKKILTSSVSNNQQLMPEDFE
jgi:sialic acid synthase SpsE